MSRTGRRPVAAITQDDRARARDISRAYRTANSLSQAALARQLATQPSVICHIEKGIETVSSRIIRDVLALSPTAAV